MRGKVLGPNSQLLPGVAITILAHPEYGQTLSRVDGLFDLAVNGGESITVNYAKSGYLSAQRQVSVPLQDFAWLPEVVLVSRDTQVTSVDLTASVPIQVVQGSIVTDQDGQRQASLLIPQGTTAEIVLPDGNTQPLTDLNIRITEFSVGPDGPKSMPAQLPPNVGYTYCVDLSVDQADALGAKKVSFSQPIFHYVENFLNFPVGMIVPSAYYDMERGSWVPSKNGRVIKVLSIQGNLAELDTDGDGTADNGISLGITIDEREKLGALYSSGQSLWRVPVTHFSPWDYNWPSALPESSRPPLQEAASSGAPMGTSPLNANPVTGWGSIDPMDQIFRETLNIAGTPFTLNYSSDRVPGWKASDTLHIPVLGSPVPSGLKYIELEIYVAGRKFIETLPALSDQAYDFTWDGKDAYGRDLTNGSQEVTISIGYAYDASYLVPSNSDPSFGQSSGVSIPDIQSRGDVSIYRLAQKATISRWDARSQGLDGWSLSEHHAYDPVGQILYLGDGRRRTAQSAGPVITTVAGTGNYLCERGDLVPGKWWCENQENIPATETPVQYPGHVLVKPDGSFFTTDTWFFGLGYEGRVRNVDVNGTISTVAGSWYCTPDGTNTADGIPATQACIDPQSLALGPDGNLYIATGQRIRKVGADGIITTVAGRYPQSYGGIVDGIPAIEADMRPRGIAFGPDRSLYFADWMYGVVRRIDPDGIITTVAGNGQPCWDWVCGDGGPATSAALGSPEYIAIAADGSIYFTDTGGMPALRKVGPDGIITTVLLGWEGYEQQLGRNWDDGIPTASALAGDLREIAFGPDGSLYVNTSGDRFGNGNPHAFIRKIDTRGIVTTVAGTFPSGNAGDGGPPAQAQFSWPEGIYISPDGSLYIADPGNSRVRRIGQSLPGTGLTSFSIPSEDATVLYDFDASGRHVATRHALTGAPLYQFYYDQLGYLSQVMDGNGNATVIERALGGAPAAILSPYGQRTALASDENGYLESLVNPASETTRLSYAEGGLLATVTIPKGDPYKFTYDNKGRLIKAEDPSNGSNTLSRADFGNGYEVTLTSAMNRITTYRLERLSSGGQHKITTLPDGTRNETLWASDGSLSETSSSGLTTNLVQGPDPRFMMMSPLPKIQTMATPGNLIYSAAIGREVYLTDPKDIFSLFNQTDTLTINGRAYITSYDAPTKTFADITPEGRQSTSTIDNLGRVTQRQVAGLLPRSYSYDSRGRVSTVTLGSGVDARITSFAYNAGNGYLETITDPMDRSVRFESDAVGRVTKKILPDGKEILYSYDANGNQTSITPPGKPEHSFTYTPVDLLSKYIAPSVAAENSTTELFSNPDRQPSGVLWPDGQSMDLNYDSAGRMSAIMPDNQRGYAYDSVTGRLTSITSPAQLLAFSYDGSLLTSESWTGTIAGTVSRSYDNNFKIASISINGGNTVAFTRDNDNLLIKAGDLSLTRNSQNGLITGTTIGNVTDSRSYNGFGEIDTYSAAYSGGGFYSVHYTRDQLGRTTRKEETSGGTTSTNDYVYDLAGRLTEVKRNGATSAQYTYDDNGNRLSAAIAGNTISGIYDAQDRLTQYGSTTYAYSGKGELVSKTEGGQVTSYQYDSLGNLTGVTLPGGTRIEYAIDGSNRRIGKKVNGNQAQGFLYKNLLKPVAELDGVGNVVAVFVYGSKTNVPDYMVKSGNTYRIISDDLGSPRIVMDVATGTIAQQMDYDEFGNVLSDSQVGFQPFGFAGGLYDPDTVLVRFGARDYDPAIGRWTAKDPIGFAASDTNLYAYVQNDPMNFIDPTGLKGGNIIVPSANTAVLLAVGGGLTASDLLFTAYVWEMYAEIMNAIGDWLFDMYMQEGYDPEQALMMVHQEVMEQVLPAFQPGLNLPPSPPIITNTLTGEVLR